MPTRTFEVEGYTANIAQYGVTEGGRGRQIVLTSPNLSHGIRNRAIINFCTSAVPISYCLATGGLAKRYHPPAFSDG